MSIAEEIADSLRELIADNPTVCKIGSAHYVGLKNFGSAEALEMMDAGNTFNKSESIRFLKGSANDSDTVTIGEQVCFTTLRGVKPETRSVSVVIDRQSYRILNVEDQQSVVVLTLKNIK